MILQIRPGTLGRTDDVVVNGKTRANHYQNLDKRTKTAQTEVVRFNSDKCAIKQKTFWSYLR